MDALKKRDTTLQGSTSQATILLVEDEPTVRMVVQKILQADHYLIDVAEDGKKALEMVGLKKYDLLLTDINLPGATGMELLHHIKEQSPTTEVILMTGYPVLSDAVKSVKVGAFDYISKPIMSDKLRTQVKAAIRKKRNDARSTKRQVANSVASAMPNHSYRVIRSLGSGNIGTVLLVEKEGRQYAMKILKAFQDEDKYQKTVQRFTREGEIVAKLDHDGIVKVHELGFGANQPVPYILMEYVDGPSLFALIGKEKYSYEDRLSVILQIAKTLEVVHAMGIIHRDIKPSNVLIAAGNRAKICDFGTARLGESALTLTCEILGSPAYMAPETFQGNSHVLDHRTDIFSLGVLSYELLTTNLPFNGESFNELVHTICTDRPVAPIKRNPKISKAVQDVLARMIEKEPKDRYGSAGEISHDLELAIAGQAHPTLRRYLTQFFDHHAWQ